MKNRRVIIYFVVLISFILVIFFQIDMGIYDKNIYKVESKQIKIFTLHNIKTISTKKLGNLTCYEGASKETEDVFFVSCYRKSLFYPLYRTIDIKVIQKRSDGESGSILLSEQSAYYGISVIGDKLIYTIQEHDFSYYLSKFLWTTLGYLLGFVMAKYRYKAQKK